MPKENSSAKAELHDCVARAIFLFGQVPEHERRTAFAALLKAMTIELEFDRDRAVLMEDGLKRDQRG